jgi:phage terminase large subunit-like protein
MLMFGLRLGDRPRVVVTTTPKPLKLLRELAAAPTTRVTRGSTFENKANLAPSFLTQIVGKHEGTRLGRQELHAELLEQADGALWTRKMLDAAFIDPAQVPEMRRSVVALDPAVTAGENSDETGIIVAGLGIDGLYYVLRDASGHFSPNEWARRAVNLRIEMDADRIVAEVNNGGDLVRGTLRTIDPALPFKAVTASKGKRTRADPIAALYEQNRVRHAGGFAELEDQLCNWIPGTGQHSPDRLDALVWALSELALEAGDTGMLDWARSQAEAAKADAG